MSEGRTPAPRDSTVVPLPAPPRREAEPLVIDAEFRALSPAQQLLSGMRRYWWALGPYLAYCAALWGLATLVGWLIERGRL